MTAIVLPTSPLPQSANPKPIDFGSWQEPTMGGVETRLDRLGNRFSMDVAMPRMKPEPNGRIWASRLVDAIGGDVQMVFPQVGLVIGSPGSPVVDGAGQAGNTLALRGFTVGYVIREGQFFNLTNGAGRTFLYKVRGSDITVGGDGKATVSFAYSFLLRSSPVDGAAANFTTPVIVGRLLGNENGWTLERIGTRGVQFTIRERA